MLIDTWDGQPGRVQELADLYWEKFGDDSLIQTMEEKRENQHLEGSQGEDGAAGSRENDEAVGQTEQAVSDETQEDGARMTEEDISKAEEAYMDFLRRKGYLPDLEGKHERYGTSMENLTAVYYTFLDIDQNGVLELLISLPDGGDGLFGYSMIYTMDGGTDKIRFVEALYGYLSISVYYPSLKAFSFSQIRPTGDFDSQSFYTVKDNKIYQVMTMRQEFDSSKQEMLYYYDPSEGYVDGDLEWEDEHESGLETKVTEEKYNSLTGDSIVLKYQELKEEMNQEGLSEAGQDYKSLYLDFFSQTENLTYDSSAFLWRLGNSKWNSVDDPSEEWSSYADSVLAEDINQDGTPELLFGVGGSEPEFYIFTIEDGHVKPVISALFNWEKAIGVYQDINTGKRIYIITGMMEGDGYWEYTLSIDEEFKLRMPLEMKGEIKMDGSGGFETHYMVNGEEADELTYSAEKENVYSSLEKVRDIRCTELGPNAISIIESVLSE